MAEEYGIPTHVPYDEIDDWIKSNIDTYIPNFEHDEYTLMDLKQTLVRGHTGRYGLVLTFHIDYPDRVKYRAIGNYGTEYAGYVDMDQLMPVIEKAFAEDSLKNDGAI
jgi:hypothetical protein